MVDTQLEPENELPDPEIDKLHSSRDKIMDVIAGMTASETEIPYNALSQCRSCQMDIDMVVSETKLTMDQLKHYTDVNKAHQENIKQLINNIEARHQDLKNQPRDVQIPEDLFLEKEEVFTTKEEPKKNFWSEYTLLLMVCTVLVIFMVEFIDFFLGGHDHSNFWKQVVVATGFTFSLTATVHHYFNKK
jgi:hypothetical protein